MLLMLYEPIVSLGIHNADKESDYNQQNGKSERPPYASDECDDRDQDENSGLSQEKVCAHSWSPIGQGR